MLGATEGNEAGVGLTEKKSRGTAVDQLTRKERETPVKKED